MTRRFVNQIGLQEQVNQVFQVSQKQLRPNRTGNLYLQVDLSDRTGTLNARMWNASDADYRNFEDGDYVRVEGGTQLFQGALQLIATNIRRARPEEIHEEDFLPLTRAEIEKMALRLGVILRGIKNPHLRNLADCFLLDESFMRRFTKAPAGVKNHHAYDGGLLEHVLNLAEVVLVVAPRYPNIDPELLLMGAFLHDMGKIEELSYEKGYAYTDEGQLIGHIVMGVRMLEDKLLEVRKLAGEPVPDEMVLRLKHMIVSHHGEYEYGSPRLPMTLEAVALHYLDNLDAKIHNFQQQMNDDPNIDSNWTTYQPTIGRKLFKGAPTGE